jgi:hypothetical protein
MTDPECRACGETYPAQRHALGYTTCLDCGDAEASAERAGWCIAPAAHKGHLTRVTDTGHLKKINKYANE